jgi:hypothetical protein
MTKYGNILSGITHIFGIPLENVILTVISSVFIWTFGDFVSFTDVTKGGGAYPYLEYGRGYALIWVNPIILGFLNE